jgi:hypothetical protein
MTPDEYQTAGPGAGIEIISMPAELDLTTCEGVAEQGYAAIAAVAAWPAIALVGSYELLMMAIRSAQVPADGTPDTLHGADPLQEQAAQLFAGELQAGRVPSVRDPRSAPRRPAQGIAAARLPRYGNCKAGGKSGSVSNLRDGRQANRRGSRATAAQVAADLSGISDGRVGPVSAHANG